MFACVRLLLVVVVAFALSDFDIVIGDAIDDAVGVVDAAAPEAFVVALERFWFAETFEGMRLMSFNRALIFLSVFLSCICQ